MSLERSIVAALLTLVVGAAASATTYESFSFDQIVRRAEVIFVGDVVDVRSYEVSRNANRSFKTRVTFNVSDSIYRASTIAETFDFLGGTVGDETMEVAGMPQFARGDRRVVLAYRGESINPIVGFTQGLLSVSRDIRGADRVLAYDGYPIGSPQAFGPNRAKTSALPIVPMTVAEFRTAITTTLAAAGKR